MARTFTPNRALLTEPELRARLGELYAAIDQYNRRWYFESHETLEDLWLVTPLPERDFFQAIIQTAAAFVHFVRGDYAGIFKLLDAAAEKLRAYEGERFGIDIKALIEGLTRVREELAELGEARFREWDEARLPPIVYDDGRGS
jgi:predicted metal-dependent hydrolase